MLSFKPKNNHGSPRRATPRDDKVKTFIMFSRDYVVPINRDSVASSAKAECGNLSELRLLITYTDLFRYRVENDIYQFILQML